MSIQVTPSTEYLANPKHSCWSVRTPLEKKLIWGVSISALLCVIFFSLTIAYGSRSRFEPPSVYLKDDPGICRTKVCVDNAKTLISYMDVSADPCEDFYTFACGSFMKSAIVPASGVTGPFHDANIQLNKDIEDILLNHPIDNTNFNSTNSALRLYRKCIEQEKNEQTGLELTRQLLTEYFGGLPMAQTTWDNETFDWSRSLSSVIRDLNPTSIFSFAAIPEIFQSLDFKFFLLFQPEEVSQFSENTIFNPQHLGNLSIARTPTDVRLIYRAIICTIYPDCKNYPNLDSEIDDLIKTWETIEALKNQAEKFPNHYTLDSLKKYFGENLEEYSYTMDNLHKKIPEVDWKSFFENIFKDTEYKVTEKFSIATKAGNISPIVKYLSSTPRRSIANYFGMSLISQSAPLFSPTILKHLGIERSRKHICSTYVKDDMMFPVVRLYIDKFISKDTLDETRQMTKDVNMAFGELLKENTWLDKETKDMALRKLNNMAGSVVSPDWVFDDVELNNAFSKVSSLKDFKFTDAFKVLSKSNLQNLAKTYSRPVDRKNYWQSNPMRTNAVYSPSTNSMFYELGIVGAPFYTFSRPRAINLGSLGYISGHEITHGFDSTGKNFDDTGKLSDWWSKQSAEMFAKRTSCLVNQYSAITDKATGLQLNGILTLGEDIADNGGIKAAYWTFKNITQQQGGRLQGMETFSEDQLFFIAMATTWCTKTSPDHMKKSIETETHSPNMYRAYVPLQNFPEFSKAFNCAKGTKMNPSNKCEVW